MYNVFKTECVRTTVFIINSKIKGLASGTKKCKSIIKNLESSKKESAIVDKAGKFKITKNHMRIAARHHMLAVAFLKQKKYSLIEQKCAKNNKPSAEVIFNIISSNLIYNIFSREQINIKTVQAWIDFQDIESLVSE